MYIANRRLFSCSNHFHAHDLRRVVQPERKRTVPQSAADVHRGTRKPVAAARQLWKDALVRSEQSAPFFSRQTELAAMRMPGKDQIRPPCRIIPEILRFMRQQNTQRAGHLFLLFPVPERTPDLPHNRRNNQPGLFGAVPGSGLLPARLKQRIFRQSSGESSVRTLNAPLRNSSYSTSP